MSVPTVDWDDPLVRRFIVKTEERPDGCWDWVGHIRRDGYAYFNHPETKLALRASWMIFRGSIPEDKEIDHLCRNRSCTRPEHLEVVTHRLNVKRGDAAIWWTRCPAMHPSEPSRWQKRRDGRMYCKECHRLAEQQRRDRRARLAAGAIDIS